MRIDWHRSWLLALAVGACSLNPQPDLPGEQSGTGPSGAAGSKGSGGASSNAAGGAAFGGSSPITTPGGGTFDSGADAGAVGGFVGEAGIGGEGPGAQEAGASGEGGTPQLAPGPAR
jgi:hypothetical protein